MCSSISERLNTSGGFLFRDGRVGDFVGAKALKDELLEEGEGSLLSVLKDTGKGERAVSELTEEDGKESGARALEGNAEIEDELEELLEEELETDELLEDEELEDRSEDALLAFKSSIAKDFLKARAARASSSRVIKGSSSPFILPAESSKDKHPNLLSLRSSGL